MVAWNVKEGKKKLFLAIATKATARSGNKATAIRIINWNSLFCVDFYFETAIKLTISAVLFLLLKKKSVKFVWFCMNKVFLHTSCCFMDLFILVTKFFASFSNSIQRVYFPLLQSLFLLSARKLDLNHTQRSNEHKLKWRRKKKNATYFRAVSKVTKCNFTFDREMENNNNNNKSDVQLRCGDVIEMVDVTWHARTTRIQL